MSTQATDTTVRESIVVDAPLERHGAGWEAVRDGVAAPEGWPLYLQRFAEVVKD